MEGTYPSAFNYWSSHELFIKSIRKGKGHIKAKELDAKNNFGSSEFGVRKVLNFTKSVTVRGLERLCLDEYNFHLSLQIRESQEIKFMFDVYSKSDTQEAAETNQGYISTSPSVSLLKGGGAI